MTAYQRGSAYEVKAANVLAADGYACWLARGSKGPADVVAIKVGQVLLVQVKSGAGVYPASAGLSHAGWNALHDLAAQVGAVPVTCYWRKWARRPTWRQITGRHTARASLWPSMPFDPDEVVAS